jgi:PAS domain S-box-containing protein
MPPSGALRLGFVAAAEPVALPSSLIWAMAILAFGMLLMVCVILLLKGESHSVSGWDVGAESRLPRGRQLQHMSRLLRAIRAINGLILSERDGQQLLQKACSSLTATRGYRMTWIGLVEEGSKRIRPACQAGFEEGYLDQIEVTWDDAPTGQGPTGMAVKTREPSVMRDIETAPEYRPWRQQALQRGYRSSAALPLRFEGQVLGALNVYSEMPEAFDIEEVGLLQEVADHLAYALGSIRLEEELAAARREIRLGQRIRTAFDTVAVGMMVTDGDGIITDVNRRMMEFLDGYASPEELVGRVQVRRLGMFKESATRRSVAELFKERRSVEFQCRVSASGGRSRALRCRGTPVIAGQGGLTETVWLVEDAADQATESEDEDSASA